VVSVGLVAMPGIPEQGRCIAASQSNSMYDCCNGFNRNKTLRLLRMRFELDEMMHNVLHIVQVRVPLM